jgi:hypothetical protein
VASANDKKTGANGAGGITLSSGKLAKIREAIGKDLEKGAAVASNPANPMSLMMGVAGQVTTIDDKPITYEDVLALPMADVLSLIGGLMGKNVLELSQLSAISC